MTRIILAALLAAGLAACNPSSSAPVAQVAAVPEPQSGPVGPGCGPQVQRFREIMVYDRSVNRVAQSTYDKALPGIAQAEAACSAGKSGEAMAILRRTKSAAGYY